MDEETSGKNGEQGKKLGIVLPNQSGEAKHGWIHLEGTSLSGSVWLITSVP